MPAPMMAPIPIAVMLNGPSAFARRGPSASPLAMMSLTDLRAIRPRSVMRLPPAALDSCDRRWPCCCNDFQSMKSKI
jgi:hypothetical protein